MQVFVLIFNARTDNEGIHTIKLGDRNVILMFESEDDATRYGLMLEAQDLPSPSVEIFEAEEITEFCRDADYDCKLVPEGTLAVPPETNVDKTDWNPDGETEADAKAKVKENSSDSEIERIRRQLEGLL